MRRNAAPRAPGPVSVFPDWCPSTHVALGSLSPSSRTGVRPPPWLWAPSPRAHPGRSGAVLFQPPPVKEKRIKPDVRAVPRAPRDSSLPQQPFPSGTALRPAAGWGPRENSVSRCCPGAGSGGRAGGHAGSRHREGGGWEALSPGRCPAPLSGLPGLVSVSFPGRTAPQRPQGREPPVPGTGTAASGGSGHPAPPGMQVRTGPLRYQGLAADTPGGNDLQTASWSPEQPGGSIPPLWDWAESCTHTSGGSFAPHFSRFPTQTPPRTIFPLEARKCCRRNVWKQLSRTKQQEHKPVQRNKN